MKKDRILKMTDLANNPDMLLTSRQIKQLLGVSDPTLYRWRTMRIIPCYKVGGTYKYKAIEIINYLNDNKI